MSRDLPMFGREVWVAWQYLWIKNPSQPNRLVPHSDTACAPRPQLELAKRSPEGQDQTISCWSAATTCSRDWDWLRISQGCGMTVWLYMWTCEQRESQPAPTQTPRLQLQVHPLQPNRRDVQCGVLPRVATQRLLSHCSWWWPRTVWHLHFNLRSTEGSLSCHIKTPNSKSYHTDRSDIMFLHKIGLCSPTCPDRPPKQDSPMAHHFPQGEFAKQVNGRGRGPSFTCWCPSMLVSKRLPPLIPRSKTAKNYEKWVDIMFEYYVHLHDL